MKDEERVIFASWLPHGNWRGLYMYTGCQIELKHEVVLLSLYKEV